MRLLLDTHVALWAIADDPRLKEPGRGLILDASNTVVVSAVSVWEIAIKRSLGRGDMPVSAADALHYFKAAGYVMLEVTAEHAAQVEQLAPIHADPFDRLLVAQALREPLRLVTHDFLVARYSESFIEV